MPTSANRDPKDNLERSSEPATESSLSRKEELSAALAEAIEEEKKCRGYAKRGIFGEVGEGCGALFGTLFVTAIVHAILDHFFGLAVMNVVGYIAGAIVLLAVAFTAIRIPVEIWDSIKTRRQWRTWASEAALKVAMLRHNLEILERMNRR